MRLSNAVELGASTRFFKPDMPGVMIQVGWEWRPRTVRADVGLFSTLRDFLFSLVVCLARGIQAAAISVT